MSFQYLYVHFALTRLRLADAKERKNPSAAKGLPKAMQEPPLSKCKLCGTWCFFEALCDTILLWKLLDLWLLHQETPRRHKEPRRNTQALRRFVIQSFSGNYWIYGCCTKRHQGGTKSHEEIRKLYWSVLDFVLETPELKTYG
jgi:hypothetical protein